MCDTDHVSRNVASYLQCNLSSSRFSMKKQNKTKHNKNKKHEQTNKKHKQNKIKQNKTKSLSFVLRVQISIRVTKVLQPWILYNLPPLIHHVRRPNHQ